MYWPSIKLVEVWKDEVADGEEVSRLIFEGKVQEDGFSVNETRRSPDHDGVTFYIRIVRIPVLHPSKRTIPVDEIQLGQADCIGNKTEVT